VSAHAAVGGGIDALEGLAATLEASGEFRILRRLRPKTATPPPEGASTRRAVFVDVETTGLDAAADEVLELAMLAFDYSTDGAYLRPVASFDRLRDPGRPVPPVRGSGGAGGRAQRRLRPPLL
jgi:DNA polymerase-3 subunit epsilon